MSDQYSIAHYGLMTRDRARLGPYVEAVRRLVTDDSVVLDIGTGTGMVAMAAAMAGARRVIAVDPNEILELARRIADDNRLGRIEFHRTLSTQLDLDEPADIIVSDLRGASPFHPGHIDAIVDARERLLADDGQLIARRDTVFAAPVEAPDAWRRHVGHWDDNLLELDLSAARSVAANVRFHHDTQPDQLVSEPTVLTSLEYTTVRSSAIDVAVEFEATRSAEIHGFTVWFESDLADDLTVSTAPGTPLLAYGRPFYPVETPLRVEPSERVEFRFRSAPVRGSYVTSWSGDGFDQSTLGVTDFSPRELDLLRPENAPRPTEEARRLHALLGWMDGDTSIDELVRRASETLDDMPAADVRAWVSRKVREHGED